MLCNRHFWFVQRLVFWWGDLSISNMCWKEHCWGYSGSLNIYVCWQIWWRASSASSSDFIAAAQCIQPHGIHIRIHTYAWDVLRRWEKDVDTVIRTAGNTGHGAEQHNMASRSPTEKKKNTYKSLHKTKHFEESCNTKLILILGTFFLKWFKLECVLWLAENVSHMWFWWLYACTANKTIKLRTEFHKIINCTWCKVLQTIYSTRMSLYIQSWSVGDL